jgi:hypothetical protein
MEPVEHIRLKIQAIMELPSYEGGMISKCLETLPSLEKMSVDQMRNAYKRLDYLEKLLTTHSLQG